MAFLLASATWFVFGIAKAVVFRERVQETADAAAFSAAVIHAKGMNLIAAINLIFFAVTAVWLTLRVFEHGMHLVQLSVTFNAMNCEGPNCRLLACEISPLSAALTASGAGGPAAACPIAYGLARNAPLADQVAGGSMEARSSWFLAEGSAQRTATTYGRVHNAKSESWAVCNERARRQSRRPRRLRLRHETERATTVTIAEL